MSLPTVAIVGRPNVGKSSLFNRLCHRRHALVDPTPGVTRDRIELPVTWGGRQFLLVDTGGLELTPRSPLAAAIRRQIQRAIETADLLLFVCDVEHGVLPLDREVADLLRRAGKPVVVVANKADTEAAAGRAVEFHVFGFGSLAAVSSSHGRGIGELLDEVMAHLPPARAAQEAAPPALRLAIVGRPNVGKSTWLNRLAGEERVTVDAAPGTTRDAIEIMLPRSGRLYGVTDTAGVRPRPKLKTLVDIVSVKRSMTAIEQADGCLLLFDVSAGVLADDLTLLGRILKQGRPCVAVFNKWDLIDAGNPDQLVETFWDRAPFAKLVPVIAASAKTGYHVEEALVLAAAVAERGRQTIPGPTLKGILHRLQDETDRPGRLRQLKLVRLRQFGAVPGRGPRRPMTVELTVHGRVRLRKSDLAFVERVIRGGADLEGVPLRLIVRVV